MTPSAPSAVAPHGAPLASAAPVAAAHATSGGRVLARRATSLAPRIVVLGGGFAGVTTALELARRCAGVLPVDVTLVSDRNFFLFTPMLAEAATGAVETRHVLHPIRPLCTSAGIEFAEMRVEAIDLARRRLTVRHSRSRTHQEIRYDRLVLALGAAPNVGMAPGAAEHALTFKGAGDAVQIRNRVIDLFEAAAVTDDPWVQRRLLTFVVVGAGHAGTELMAALEELTRGILLRHYPSIPADAARLVLVGSAILPQTATNLAAYAKERLLGRGIQLEPSRAAKVSAEGLELQDGRLIPSHCVIWTAGNRVNPVVTALPVAKARDGRLLVNEFFEVQGAPGVYALGDNAAQTDPHTGEAYVATAQVALRQGRALAAQLEATLSGRARRPFRFKLLGEMVPLSRRTAVADLMGWKLTGFSAWFLWKTIYMLKLPTLATRVRVVLDWSVELFFERDVSELTVDEKAGA
jgi:NADH:ubiquinone reductase (H+-translocating)